MAKSLFSKLSQLVGLTEAISPEEYATEVIDAMAEEMPPREGVWWAVLSGKEVAGDLTHEDLAALEAAEAWVMSPSEETVAAAEEALKDVDYQGPGAWAAVAATAVPLAAAIASGASGAGLAVGAIAPAAAAASPVAPKAVAGAVKIAAAIAAGNKPQPVTASEAAAAVDAVSDASAAQPAVASAAEAAKTAEALKPFIDVGKDVMEGTNTWN